MAGSKSDGFAELLSPFLRQKIADATGALGPDAEATSALTRQYLYDDRETAVPR